ncbi:MAG: monovalent cation/H(+) antiporter subunit G [Desulfuromonadales bacterium]|nr:monovalent cation/H(+) antiporter subunit G [Desulfuromonadales bacterium]MDW7756062.1 monovalent cation/H(+) antiporter subunit G [Desulfuromonadales bacterium]
MSIVSAVLIVGGLFFFGVGVVGILRLPDFYTRLHGASKCDTLGAFLILSGLALHVLTVFDLANVLVSLKIMAIAIFISIASPTATHAITEGALIAGVEPWRKGKGAK